MTEDELERLALLAEECAEVIQIVNKIIRHGYDSYHPLDKDKRSNKVELEKELGHLKVAVHLLIFEGDVDKYNIDKCYIEKVKTVEKWLHHNTIGWKDD